jgi:hypothetical protein
MKDKRKVEGSQKSTTITNKHFEVFANLNRTTDCNPTEMGRKFHPGSRKILQKNRVNGMTGTLPRNNT